MRTSLFIQRVILTCAIALFLTNTAQADPTGWPYPETITLPYCAATYDFHLESPDCEVWHYEILSGPGTLGDYTGIWVWSELWKSHIGSYSLIIKIRNYCGGEEYQDTLGIQIIDGGIAINSGLGTVATWTNQETYHQLTATSSPCPADHWSVFLHGQLQADYDIGNGLMRFSAPAAGVYTFDVWAYAGTAYSEPGRLTYIVHGGPGCCAGSRGDITADGLLDLSDLSRLIAYMTSPNIVLNCWDAANIDGAGSIDLTDLSMLINFMVNQGAVALPMCP
jgi:hypothetical protein